MNATDDFYGGWKIEGSALLIGKIPGHKSVYLYEEKPGRVVALARVYGDEEARALAKWLDDLARSRFKEPRHFLVTLPETQKETQ